MTAENKNIINQLQPVEFNPFAGPEIIRVIPVIEPQLEIWISCLIGGPDANRSYNESVSLRLKGKFFKEAMESALQDLVSRHEALRSAFSADGKQICIFKEPPFHLIYQDISAKSIADQEKFISDFSKQDAQTAFNLLEGPLFRPALFKLGEEEHYLTLTAHHIVCDGWSLGIMMQDLGKLYSAYAQGKTPELAPAVSFSRYALDQNKFYQSSEYKQIEQYWIDQYKSEIPVTDIPTDFSRPPDRTYKSHRDDYSLDPELVSSVRKMGAASGCSFVTTLLVAYEVLIHRLTGQQEIVLGLPAAGQSATGNYGLVGHCVNLLPLRSHLNTTQTFLEYLKQRKAEILNDYDRQQLSFGSLLKKLNITRDASRVPLIQLVFNIDMGMDDGVEFYGLKHSLIYNPRDYETFEIFLNVSGRGDEVVLEWSYNTQLYRGERIEGMMRSFEGML
ncbi:MAG TPA: condensation domain-containing protein, partial [Puia sp.]|nr:condensation domain-containing protein [Puia sp.]